MLVRDSQRIRVVLGLKKEDKKMLVGVQTRKKEDLRRRDNQQCNITGNK